MKRTAALVVAVLAFAGCFPGSLNGGAVGVTVPKVALEWVGPARAS
ncbi:MAG: hypothetical protein U0229_23005 [Anaeromyxobacter sp.]